MAIYKRYNTRRKKLDARIVFPVVAVAAVFLLTVLFGLYLGNKAKGVEPLYTGTNDIANVGDVLAPLSEKSVRGEYVAPEICQNLQRKTMRYGHQHGFTKTVKLSLQPKPRVSSVRM